MAAAVLVVGPLLVRRGFALTGDMSFVPRQPWKSVWLGLDGSAPRAVPADAIVSSLSVIVPGDLVQKAVLLGALVLVGWGTARLVRDLLGVRSVAAQAAAGVLALWNPYVLERLAIGHWGLLLGYAALPWVALAAAAVRRGEPGALARLVLALAPAALGSPTGGLLAAVVALVFVLGPGFRTPTRLRRVGAALGCVLLMNLPWLLPGLTGAQAGDDPTGVEAFAARADTPFGLPGSLVTLGGIWKASIVPGERDSWFLVALALVVSLAALALLVRTRRTRLVWLSVLGLALAALPATGPGGDLVAELVEHVPGAGLLRDSQKWLALTALGVAAGFGLVVDRLTRDVRRLRLPARPFQAGLLLLPLVVLPSLAWGISGDLDPVRYPADWDRVSAVLEDQPTDRRRTVVLPFSAYQRFAWNDGRAALDPALRYLPGQVVTNDELRVSADEAVAGDSPTAARIAAAVRSGEALAPVLADAGIRFVLVEHSAAGGDDVLEPAGQVLYDGPDLRLIDVGGPAELERADHPVVVIAGDVLAAVTLFVSACFLAIRRIPRRTTQMG